MWDRIIKIKEWFGEIYERHSIVSNFNKTAKMAFISGLAPTQLKASISSGDSNYRHSFSSFRSGFRIVALTGNPLSREAMKDIGNFILLDTSFVRQLVSCGFDTLEVTGEENSSVLKWKLSDYALLGGILTSKQP
jgi:hypothetical protein